MQKAIKFVALFITILSSIGISSQHLLTNGDFESGGAANGFQTDYSLVASNSTQSDYAVVSNAGPINSNFSNVYRDHTSTTGKMMVVDDANSAPGNDFALDYISLAAPLSLTYSITNLTCVNANDGTIFGYGIGGTGNYTNYTLSGTTTSGTPILPISNGTGFFTGLEPGNYTLEVTDSALDNFSLSNIIIPPVGLTLTEASTSICAGDTTTLTATGGGPYTWSVDNTQPIPTGSNPTVSPSVTTTYTVNSNTVTSDNLIYNGDFFLGNVGFTSDYDFSASNTGNLQKVYGVVTDPSSWESGFADCGDQTTGAGLMMVIDGSSTNGGNDKVWCQTVPVTPGQDYNFSYWIQTLALPELANIDVVINGFSLGTNLAPPLCSTTGTPWIARNFPWNSGVNTTAEICLYNRNFQATGNDFALDGLVFSRINNCGLQSQSVTITVTNNVNLVITDPPAVCSPATVDITAAAVTAGSTTGLTLSYWSDPAATASPLSLAAAAAIGTSETYYIRGTIGPCSDVKAVTVVVNQPVAPLFGLFPKVCEGDTAPPSLPTSSLNTPPITGIWTPPTINTASVGTVTYTFTPAAGQCVTTSPPILLVEVLPVLSPNFAQIAPFCDGFLPVPDLLPTSPNGITGTWNPSIVDESNSSTYVFTPITGQCALGTQTMNITVIPRTVPDFAAVAPFCKNSLAPVLPLPSLNGISGTWSPAIVDNTVSGIFPYLFTPDPTECATTATLFVEVTEPTFPGFPDLAFCNGGVTPPLPPISPNGGINGTWLPTTIDNTIDGTYVFTPDAGQCAIPQVLNVTIYQYTLFGVEGIVTNYFEDNQVITILATNTGNYLYQLDFGPLQESNVFQNVSSGLHTINVVDANGCANPLSKEIMVVNYPKLFTPNEDGYNDRWNISGLAEQLDSKIFIYDRYGKLMKQITPRGDGWDGTFNGQLLPGDDYWFIMEYEENGSPKEFKSHFSMKR